MDIRLLKYRTRINQAENGTLLRACIEIQKRDWLDYETKCQQIIETLGGRDVTEEGKNSKKVSEAVHQLRVLDRKNQLRRLKEEVTRTTKLYVRLQGDNQEVKQPAYVEHNSARTHAIATIFSMRSGNPQLAAI